MDLNLKERIIVEFLAKERCGPIEIHNRLKNVYEGTVMDISDVQRWVRNFEMEKRKLQINREVAGRQQKLQIQIENVLMN